MAGWGTAAAAAVYYKFRRSRKENAAALCPAACVRRDGKDENLLKQLLKKHERAPFVGARRGPLPGVFVPRVSVRSTSAERADALALLSEVVGAAYGEAGAELGPSWLASAPAFRCPAALR